MTSLDSKVALITGGSRGVGRALALALASRRCSVAINHRDSAAQAEETVRFVEESGGRAICVRGDTANDDDCRRMIAVTAERFGRLDILVNNAATTEFIPYAEMEKLTTELWDRIFAVNVRGPFQCVRAARDLLQATGAGHVINISSIAGLDGSGSSIPYAASKAALINMTQSLARTLAPSVQVNSIAPGFIDSQWTHEGLGTSYAAISEIHKTRAAMQAICRPEDVADAVMSLLEGSRLVTGQTLVCDAGAMIAARS
jgi:3-oxoacyl-[acyl-carrier protein] reductase